MAVTPFQLTEPFLMDGFNSRISEINTMFSEINTMFNGLGNEYVWEKRDSTSIVGYVNSLDPNAYPPAVSDGYTYKLIGQLGEKVQLETVSYTGTGVTTGKTITFSNNPKLVFIFSLITNAYYGMGIFARDCFCFVTNSTSSATSLSYIDAVWNDNSLTFSGDYSDRINASNYNYVAYAFC